MYMKTKKEIFSVVIKRCKKNFSWYYNKVGNLYNVYLYDKKTYMVEGDYLMIRVEDAEVVV